MIFHEVYSSVCFFSKMYSLVGSDTTDVSQNSRVLLRLSPGRSATQSSLAPSPRQKGPNLDDIEDKVQSRQLAEMLSEMTTLSTQLSHFELQLTKVFWGRIRRPTEVVPWKFVQELHHAWYESVSLALAYTVSQSSIVQIFESSLDFCHQTIH